MILTQEQVSQLARLARLQLTPEEIKKYANELGEVLAYVNIIQQAPVNNIKFSDQIATELRSDTVVPTINPTELTALAFEREGAFIKVPPVFGE
jgi:aspartyl-tRNA(Asn)/glutamyl-tRNA(Gln) amidotransferase subunit C